MRFKLSFLDYYRNSISIMAHYHVCGLIPDSISQSEGYKMFEKHIASGAPMYNFEGFELLSRSHAPETGEVFVTFKEANHQTISKHFGVSRAKFGLNWNITAVLTDDEVMQINKQVADAITEMG